MQDNRATESSSLDHWIITILFSTQNQVKNVPCDMDGARYDLGLMVVMVDMESSAAPVKLSSAWMLKSPSTNQGDGNTTPEIS